MLGKTILEERNKKGWTQTDLASKLGVSRSYIAEIESGKFIPKLSLLNRIAEILTINKNTVFQIAADDATKKDIEKLNQRHAGLKEQSAVYGKEELPDKIQSLIKKHPETIEILNEMLTDERSFKLHFTLHKSDKNIKEMCDTILSMPDKKRKGLLTFIKETG